MDMYVYNWMIDVYKLYMSFFPLSYSRQNAAHVEDFRIQICQIGHNEYKDRLYDAYMIREACHQTG